MAKFSEIVAKILGADQTKEYNFTLEEINTTPPTPDTQTPPENTPSDKPGADNNDSTVELKVVQAQLAELMTQNEQLKELNRKLVLGTPAEPELTTEQRILTICYPSALGKENSNG